MTSTRPVPQGHSHLHSAIHRKKRGGGGGGGGGEGGVHRGEVDDEAAFISSSRDASEEDNDDASGYSDSASSLRAAHKRPSSLNRSTSNGSGLAIDAHMSTLPTSARDKVLIDSRPSAMNSGVPNAGASQLKKAATDRTPSSSSPPVDASKEMDAIASTSIGPAAALTRPKRETSASAAVSATITQAAAALSSASSAELVPKAAHTLSQEGSPISNFVPAGSMAKGSFRRIPSSSSAGSDFPSVEPYVPRHNDDVSRNGDSSASAGERAASRRSDGPSTAPGTGLHLGVLPPANPHPIGGMTPKAEASHPLRTSTGKAVAQSGNSISHSRRTSALNGVKTSTPLAASTAAVSGGETETPGEGETSLSQSVDMHEKAPELDPDGTTPYDGDVEFAARTPITQHTPLNKDLTGSGGSAAASALSPPRNAPAQGTTFLGSALSETRTTRWHSSPSLTPSEEGQEPIRSATASDIRQYFHEAIYEPKEGVRDYTIALPPDGGTNSHRPVRIYADGVYDLFHYAHALQLRQAKLAFPHVHLIVGVCSSSSCASHKNEPLLTSAERYEAVRNCRWVDEVLEDAPWVVDQTLLDKLKIDYVAHDEQPYAGSGIVGPGQGSSDIYRFVKDQGKFLPTRRTPGISTSDLIARIVEVYRAHGLDKKLQKMGKEGLTLP